MQPAPLAPSVLSVFDASSLEVPPESALGRCWPACVPAAMCLDVPSATMADGESSEWTRWVPSAGPMFVPRGYGSEEPVTKRRAESSF